jgi:hypothetical protein
LFLKTIGRLFVLLLLAAPSIGAAQVTITGVDVVVGGTHYCDTNTACGNQIWTLPSGSVTLMPGQTLILTQTGTQPGGGNFDTSDRGPAVLSGCTSANPCAVEVSINFGSGLMVVYPSSTAAVPLNRFNMDTAVPSPTLNESAPWTAAVTASTYEMDFGYADNEHTDACPATPAGCFPQPAFGTGGATVFLGFGLSPSPSLEACGQDAGHPVAPPPGGGCYDAGAIRIAALMPPPVFQGCTPGFWKQDQHFNSWTAPYAPTTLVKTVFTIPASLASFGNETLLTALQGGGGPGLNGAVQILLRAAVAAVLNAASSSVTYPLSVAQIQSLVKTALATLDRDTILALATQLDNDNNLGCPLN